MTINYYLECFQDLSLLFAYKSGFLASVPEMTKEFQKAAEKITVYSKIGPKQVCIPQHS